MTDTEKWVAEKVASYHFKKTELNELYETLYERKKSIHPSTSRSGDIGASSSSSNHSSSVERSALKIISLEERIKELDHELWIIDEAVSKLSKQESAVIIALTKGRKITELSREWKINRKKLMRYRDNAICNMAYTIESQNYLRNNTY